MQAIKRLNVTCGYAHIGNLMTGELKDRQLFMSSFFSHHLHPHSSADQDGLLFYSRDPEVFVPVVFARSLGVRTRQVMFTCQ